MLERSHFNFLVQNYEASSIPVLILDSGFTIRWQNAAFSRSIGFGRELTGTRLSQAVSFHAVNTPMPPEADPENPPQQTPEAAEELQEPEELEEVLELEELEELEEPEGFDSLGPETDPGTLIPSIPFRPPTAQEGYSRKARIFVSRRDFLTVEAKMIMTPLFGNGSEIPEGYTVLFDDITREFKTLLEDTYLGLLEASKLKDNDTGQHIQRVGEYARHLAEHLFPLKRYPEVTRDFIENINFLAPMHDVGKIGTPDDILNKKGALDEREWSIMKEHTLNGAFILSKYPDSMAVEIARGHHEKWNGSGYPYGLSGSDIPLAARITALADVYDALRMKRSYKEPISHSGACDIIAKDSGSHFDPELCDYFLEISKDFDEIYNRLAD